MNKPNLRKVQTYLSHDAPMDREINDFISRSYKGRKAGIVRELLYIAWGAVGSMSQREFTTRFPNVDYADFKNRYSTSKTSSADGVEPKTEEAPSTSNGGQASKAFTIKPPKAR